ncbi:hypothetical protein HJC23_011438 [Cyclotella cryptica]|uniref:PhoD-like phosphatase metallophosphatase domain-containing protein n=1 Tax=Cyclotella cryptica TaxID=29204 RepID=A0ABD3P202_9STRA|eukprot:CCRYP_018195-RA/>CCRYP_018195-RA protein AED:0.00 eAED:0.00 QI:45/-1/1/1/-1/1/1/94/688
MPQHRIAIASCSHPSLPQPLWPIISSRDPAAFVWAGDAIYADVFAGLDWRSVGLKRVSDDNGHKRWRFTFPPPSIHQDATPEIIRSWYTQQWEGQSGYREFVEGNNDDGKRPLIFGTIDDHDYGANNGDATYLFRRESNLEFMDFLYAGVPDDRDDGSNGDCRQEARSGLLQGTADEGGNLNEHGNEYLCSNQKNDEARGRKAKRRSKANDPMYQRALQGKGVYGVQLFDFSRDPDASMTHDDVLWGNGYWVPEEEALIDPDLIPEMSGAVNPTYSTTHSVAIFVLDVRSNKTPWPNKKNRSTRNRSTTTTSQDKVQNQTSTLTHDFLGLHQWKWLQSALSNSRAAINIIVSGLQIHPQRFPNDGNVLEEWSKFPEAQQLLYDTVLNSGVNSPLFVSGDVHMSQILRKDCVRREVLTKGDMSEVHHTPKLRPLIEVTTSGMTHSWGTSFSSQPKHHQWPLWPYSYFISRTFMTVAHYVLPWRDLVIRNRQDVEREERDGPIKSRGGKIGKQFELGLNFGEFDFDFGENSNVCRLPDHDGCHSDDQILRGGAVTVRIFGKETNQPPKLEMKWTFDELSGKTPLPGISASYPEDFTTVANQLPESQSSQSNQPAEWVCLPYRGVPHIAHVYIGNIVMFVVFCLLFFLPHIVVVVFFLVVRRRLLLRKQSQTTTSAMHSTNWNGRANGCKG